MNRRKPTTDEMAERIAMCRSILLRGVPKSKITRAFCQRSGADIDHGAIERRLTGAAGPRDSWNEPGRPASSVVIRIAKIGGWTAAA
jgi:hypothetical protein